MSTGPITRAHACPLPTNNNIDLAKKGGIVFVYVSVILYNSGVLIFVESPSELILKFHDSIQPVQEHGVAATMMFLRLSYVSSLYM
jgi:hypothetical protein